MKKLNAIIFFGVVGLGLPLCLSGCGSSGGSSAQAGFPPGSPTVIESLFIPNSGGSSTEGASVDLSNAGLTNTGQVGAGTGPVFVKTHPNQQFVYVANQVSGSVSAYAVAEFTGQLTGLSSSPYPTESTPVSLAIDPTGTFLYASGATAITVFHINSDGSLTSLANQALGLPAATAASVMTQNASGTFLNVATGNGAQAVVFTFAISPSSGLLTAVSNVTETGLAFSGLAVSGNTVYAALETSSTTGQLLPLAVNADGSLTAQTPTSLPQAPGEVVTTSSGSLYVASTSGIFAFTGAATGDLSPITGSPFASGTPIQFLSLDRTQTLLYGSSPAQSQIYGFLIGSDGTLATGASFTNGLASPGHTDFWEITVTGI